MNNCKVSISIEPIDKYEKAKQDLIQALQSIQSLTPDQQQHLAEELFGAQRVALIIQLLGDYFGCGKIMYSTIEVWLGNR